MGNVLIIDDDNEICETMHSLLLRQHHSCRSAHTISEGKLALVQESFDIIFLDVSLPDGNGLNLLQDISGLPDAPEVIILTGQGDPDGAELAIKGGVWDYLLKPSSVREINLTLSRAIRYRQEKLGNRKAEVSTEKIIGESPEMKDALKQVSIAAHSDVNVLITGETGTGKEIFSKVIHENSKRKNGEFVVVDCASLTESLVESILFGHRKGAFTGAHDTRAGLIKLADNGTLFLDEIGEMPMNMQKSFLRVLQERTFRAVGDSKEQSSNFRLIAATNKDLDQMARQGTFREDLLYRIKAMIIHLPPLRLRAGDIRLLTDYQSNLICSRQGIPLKTISSGVYDLLDQYNWPGNVRELFNTVERAVASAGTEKQLFAAHLPSSLRIEVTRDQLSQQSKEETVLDKSESGVRKNGQFHPESKMVPLKEYKNILEKEYLVTLIERYSNSIPDLLQISGLSRSHFYSLLKKHDLSL